DYISSFFFQAEDGIRDFHVTGVQTCALPISPLDRGPPAERRAPRARGAPPHPESRAARGRLRSRLGRHHLARGSRGGPRDAAIRSEERRVGKRCKYRAAPQRTK